MFQKTRIRLAMQNSIILILIIGAIAFAVYSYMQVLLYSDLDDDLETLLDEYKKNGYIQLEASLSKPTFIQDPRVNVILWDEKGAMIEINQESALFSSNKELFKPDRLHKIEEKEAQGYHFRSISSKFTTKYGDITVQLLRNVNSEQEMLHRIGTLLTMGTIIGGFLSIVAGLYLAGVALVPIREAWNKQQQFVSDASHELRTPLAVIQSRADLLLRSPSDTIEDKALDISVISKECRRLTKLVSNLLLLARADSRRVDIKKESFVLTDVLREVVDNYVEIAEFQGKKLVMKSDSEIIMKGDSERIHQLLVILLDNSLKFTEENGEIIVQSKKLSNGFEIIVSDNGMGINKNDLPYVFDRFYQGEKTRSKSVGTGLGLSIAKWIVEQHNGRLRVVSEEGKGTMFKAFFPK
ncbi:sensor histidine kinase [Bacillus massiliigorillae]|uniref:sensor histidine kinase n=1 Tax=Bacillus massiliigorillae TaxID=1243664 RepID=UPI00039DD6B3|nr:HAMP domain-containing sensor histidine kinase [Bacillus massiliigorillae]